MRQIVLDTETTGLRVENGDRIVEIGCVEIIDRRRTNHNLHFYLNPQRDMPVEAFRIHGLSNEFLADKPIFSAIATEFIDYITGAELIIHNAAFDIGFLNYELKMSGKPAISSYTSAVTDTLQIAKEMFPGKRNSLDMLCERFAINNSNRTLHGALLDAQLLADVYICMTRGQESLILTSQEYSTANETRNDLAAVQLPILKASQAEISQHHKVLELIDKKSDNKTLWRKLIN